MLQAASAMGNRHNSNLAALPRGSYALHRKANPVCDWTRICVRASVVLLILVALISSVSCSSVFGNSTSGTSPRTRSVGSAPRITAITPAAATAGTQSVTLTVDGSNFSGDTRVRWNSVAVPTAKAGKTLQVTITAAQLAAPGTAQVVAVDSSTGMVSNAVTFSIAAPPPSGTTFPLAITTTSLPSGKVGLAYQTNLSASGGTPPYLWTVSGLPTGLSPSSAGIISGTPVSSASAMVTLQVSDANRSSATVQAGLNIAGYSSLAITPANQSIAVNGAQQFAATLNWTDGSATDATSIATWKSSDTSKVTVSGGLVTGVAAGSALIGATYNSYSGQASITVTSTATPPVASCPAPNYCADTSTGLKPYSGSLTSPPLLNQSFTDPEFNRKIWRITDTTTGAGQPFSPPWHPPSSGVWNSNQTLMILGTRTGGDILFNVNVSNPSAPNVTPQLCSWTHTDDPYDTCVNGKVYPSASTAGSAFGNTNPDYSYGWSQNVNNQGQLVRLNWTNTPVPGGTATVPPTRTLLYDPFAAGHCLHPYSYNGAGPLMMDASDTYFYGSGDSLGRQFVYKKGSGCIVINNQTTPWKVSDTWDGSEVNVTTQHTDGTAAPDIAACGIHGLEYDAISNTVQLSTNGCAGQSHYWNIDLTNHIARDCGLQCGGHDWGPVNQGGGGTNILSIDLSNDRYTFYAIPYTSPNTHTQWGQWQTFLDVPTEGYIDYHPNGVWSVGLPWVGVVGFFSWNPVFAPPLNSMTVTNQYEGEIDTLVYTGSSFTTYRFVHNYTAAGNYNSGSGQYPWGVLTAFSPDRCWVAFSSNWMGHLGDFTASPPTTACTAGSPQNCRYDTFLTYLCGSSGT